MNELKQDNNLLMGWNEVLTRVAEILEVPVALVMKVNADKIGAYHKNNNQENPYTIDEYTRYDGSGFYCERVVKTNDMLHVENALENEDWRDGPNIALGMIAYLGIPLWNVDNSVFGTICLLDSKPNPFSDKAKSFLYSFKQAFELQLKILAKQQLAYQKQDFYSQVLMAQGVAHELNTPLGICMTSSTQLQETVNSLTKDLEDQSLTTGKLTSYLSTISMATELLSGNVFKMSNRLEEMKRSISEISLNESLIFP
ncbi:GAF domain-containing protein [Vibrio campbellii]|uniref:GAF domain-containing protein n=1 Tax=Vibrio campbellii TaxID=680 RepID=A0AAQ2XZT2_9VIBR|nr:GAF domain-containing protein [Vibrio campbellii]WDG08980.1 GAF domain-containing protein [Vibrio campbellii]